MPLVRTSTGDSVIFVTGVDHHTTAEDAARNLWDSVHEASKHHGGVAVLRTPEQGEYGYLVHWEHGPEKWANTYVLDEEANAPEFTTDAEDGDKVRFTDLA